MKIQWEKDALLDLEEIRFYIDADKPSVAQKVVKQIIQSVGNLRAQPLMGRPGRVPNTRELVMSNSPYIVALMSNSPYIVAYMVDHGVIFILRVLHTSRQWLPRN